MTTSKELELPRYTASDLMAQLDALEVRLRHILAMPSALEDASGESGRTPDGECLVECRAANLSGAWQERAVATHDPSRRPQKEAP